LILCACLGGLYGAIFHLPLLALRLRRFVKNVINLDDRLFCTDTDIIELAATAIQ
jgi:hypothetical protein